MVLNKEDDDEIKTSSIDDEIDEKDDSELEELKKQLEEEKKKAAEYNDHWKRAMADFQNYKKRQGELFGELVGVANQELILAMLPVFDTFCLAVNYVPEDIKNTEWVKGVVQVKSQFGDLLKSKGLEEIKSIGEKFNPEFYEAVEMIDSKKPEGEILEEVQKGYKLNGTVLRTAKVKVAKQKK